ncbi:hypothetical protein Bbelb_392770 [Branchiostoma belcheri]|nr:hypothetical protein Bbelb_392770 [Branchiostoma belcheri]
MAGDGKGTQATKGTAEARWRDGKETHTGTTKSRGRDRFSTERTYPTETLSEWIDILETSYCQVEMSLRTFLWLFMVGLGGVESSAIVLLHVIVSPPTLQQREQQQSPTDNFYSLPRRLAPGPTLLSLPGGSLRDGSEEAERQVYLAGRDRLVDDLATSCERKRHTSRFLPTFLALFISFPLLVAFIRSGKQSRDPPHPAKIDQLASVPHPTLFHTSYPGQMFPLSPGGLVSVLTCQVKIKLNPWHKGLGNLISTASLLV